MGTSARSQLYLLLSDSFQVPDEEFYEDIRCGNFTEWIREVSQRLPYELDLNGTVEMLSTEVDYKEFNSEFISLFEVAITAPRCPLNESQFMSGQTGIFEDLVRFYNYFGLSAAQARELPDHLRIELEFMHFLTFKEAEALHAGLEHISFLTAERDFLQRHLGRWVPLLHQKVEEFARLDFFKCLAKLLDLFISSECDLLLQDGIV